MRERVARKFAVAGSSDRVVLFSWGEHPEPRKRNVARVTAAGEVVWRAELPSETARDCFISLAADGDGYIARTYSEWVVHLSAQGDVRRAERQPAMV